jgi:hypothetical protein
VARLVEAMSGLDADEQAELGRLCRKLGRTAAALAVSGPLTAARVARA